MNVFVCCALSCYHTHTHMFRYNNKLTTHLHLFYIIKFRSILALSLEKTPSNKLQLTIVYNATVAYGSGCEDRCCTGRCRNRCLTSTSYWSLPWLDNERCTTNNYMTYTCTYILWTYLVKKLYVTDIGKYGNAVKRRFYNGSRFTVWVLGF